MFSPPPDIRRLLARPASVSLQGLGRPAKHATYDALIDMKPSCHVLAKGEDLAPSSGKSDTRKQMRKREGFFLVLGTLLESLHWFG